MLKQYLSLTERFTVLAQTLSKQEIITGRSLTTQGKVIFKKSTYLIKLFFFKAVS